MRRALAALALVLPLVGCGGEDQGDDTTLTVFAASSLTATFGQLAEEFEHRHHGVHVELSFGGSSDLVTQIREGAPADVFASADERTMDQLVADGLDAAEPVRFASNTLEIAVPPGNPARVRSFADLARRGVDVVVCAPEVPCGAAARSAADKAGVTLHPVSEEQSVTDVLAKVSSGEADAGLVYVTDVRAAADDVEGIALPAADRVVNDYPIAPVADSDHEELAKEFVDLVAGPTGRRILARAGFGPPR